MCGSVNFKLEEVCKMEGCIVAKVYGSVNSIILRAWKTLEIARKVIKRDLSKTT